MNYPRLLIIGLIFLLFTSLASAEIVVDYYSQGEVSQPQTVPEDTDVIVGTASYISDNNIRMCACSEYQEIFKLLNSGTQAESYELTPNLAFVKLFPSEFSLEAGEVKEILLTVDAPCRNIDKTLEVKVFNSEGFQGELKKDLKIGTCQNLEISLAAEKSTFKPCEVMEHELYITNAGPFTEDYKVTSSLGMEPLTVTLDPGQEEMLELQSSFSCGIYGEESISFFVEALNNDLVAEATHELLIEEDYGFSMILEEDKSVCEEYPESLLVTLEKEGSTPNKYHLELSGEPDFVNLSAETVEIGADEDSEDVEITFDIDEGKHTGTYDFMLEARSEYGEVVKTRNVTLTVEDCHDMEFKILGLEKEFCAEEQEFQLEITNHGTVEETLDVMLLSDTIRISTDELNLEPGEEVLVDASIAPEDLSTDAEVRFNLTYSGYTDTLAQEFQVYSLWDCYEVSVSKTRQSFRYHKPGSFEVVLKHKGHKGGIYDVSLEVDPLISFTQIEDENSTHDGVELYPGEVKRFYVESDHSEADFMAYEGYLAVDFGGLEYGEPVKIVVKDKSLCQKAYEYFKDNPCHFISLVLILLIIAAVLIAIFAKKRRTKLNRKAFGILLAGLALILIVLAGILLYTRGMPYLNEPIDYTNESSTHYIWAEDDNLVLSIEDVVQDPDAQDNITVQLFESNDNINLSFEDGDLIFTPKADWYGVEEVFILARDDKGAFAVSPEITLEVVEREEYNLIGVYQKLCIYFNWLLLLILFVFVSLIAYKRFRKKVKKPVRKNKTGKKAGKSRKRR